jgi:hypothetical protein
MRRAGLSSGLYLLMVFLSGAAVGGFAHRLYTVNTVLAVPNAPKPDDYRRDFVNEMHSRLKLSDQQLTQLTSIMDNTRTRYHDVKARWDRQSKDAMRPELKAIQAESIQKIKGILSEPQQAEYDKLRADREKRHQANKAKAAAGQSAAQPSVN